MNYIISSFLLSDIKLSLGLSSFAVNAFCISFAWPIFSQSRIIISQIFTSFHTFFFMRNITPHRKSDNFFNTKEYIFCEILKESLRMCSIYMKNILYWKKKNCNLRKKFQSKYFGKSARCYQSIYSKYFCACYLIRNDSQIILPILCYPNFVLYPWTGNRVSFHLAVIYKLIFTRN